MRGDPGTDIKLVVIREGADKPLPFTVTRDIISVKSVKSRILEPDYGYVRISNFQSKTARDLVSEVSKLKKDNKNELKGLVLAGDGFSMTGALEAINKSSRKDVVIVAAGNSKTGMDSIKAGDALAITYQSAEGDGAIAVHTAAEWFQGKQLQPVRYLPKHIITQADVDQFIPAQW